MRHSIISLLLTIGTLFSCGDDDDCCVPPPQCEECCEIILDERKLGSVTTDIYTITNISIDEDCLILSIASSGCGGSTWYGQLYSGPVRSNGSAFDITTIFELENNEPCDAIVEKDFSYDISYLSKPTSISIIGYDEVIVYE